MSYQVNIYDENAKCPLCHTRLEVAMVGDFVLRTCEPCRLKRIEVPRTQWDSDDRKGAPIRLVRTDA